MGTIIGLFIFELVTTVSAVGLLYKMPGTWPGLVATFLLLQTMLNAGIWAIVLMALDNEKKNKGGTIK